MFDARAGLTRKGFTLLELVLMLAILAIVSSVIVPVAVGMLKDADRARAEADVQQLTTALTRFYADLRRLPSCAGKDCSRIGLPDSDGLTFLAVGEGDGDLSRSYPAERPGLRPRWNLRANDEPSRGARNNAFNHLIRNDPNADGVIDARDYPRTRPGWQGPYLVSLGPDPWGRAYIATVGAIGPGRRPLSPGAGGWVLSAGPNGVLETAPDASVLGGDDIGVIFDARRLGPERDDARVHRDPSA